MSCSTSTVEVQVKHARFLFVGAVLLAGNVGVGASAAFGAAVGIVRTGTLEVAAWVVCWGSFSAVDAGPPY